MRYTQRNEPACKSDLFYGKIQRKNSRASSNENIKKYYFKLTIKTFVFRNQTAAMNLVESLFWRSIENFVSTQTFNVICNKERKKKHFMTDCMRR